MIDMIYYKYMYMTSLLNGIGTRKSETWFYGHELETIEKDK